MKETVLLCRDCPHMKLIHVGKAGSYYAYCKASAFNKRTGRQLGVSPDFKTPHAKCPLGERKKKMILGGEA